MLDDIDFSSMSKALPPVGKLDELPKPPLSPSRPDLPLPPPPLPPKINLDIQVDQNGLQGDKHSPLRSAPPSPFREALSIPEISTPPDSPAFTPSSTSLGLPSPPVEGKQKKVNPFVDLIETEKSYVDTLSGIIRKVASAWSRSNLPPRELDSMFRCIESIFKANRFFLSKLKEIGPNPSSPRVIGDLLMKWSEHLDSPYTAYCSQFMSGFDSWFPVQSNPRLASVLDTFSASNPPPTGPSVWTLDGLFALPRSRIKYYQKLYGRLLKSSGKGKNTDKTLVDTVEKLDRMMTIVEERAGLTLPTGNTIDQPDAEAADEIVIDTRDVVDQKHGDSMQESDARISVGSSARASSHSNSSGQRSSRDTAPTSDGRSSTGMPSMSMAELEMRLSTDRCCDLFSMTPRNVRLSINSANIPYTRELRLSEDCSIHFTPQSTGQELVHNRGHIFLLTDLLLICERMMPGESSSSGSDNADMWLCYPPLAAKHVRAATFDDDSLEISILRKEKMLLRTGSTPKRDFMIKEFLYTTGAASSLPPPSKQPAPPLPSIPGLPRSPSTPALAALNTDLNMSLHSKSANASPRPMSPASANPSMQRVDPHRPFSLERDSTASTSSSRATSLSGHNPGSAEPPPYSPEGPPSRGPPSRNGSTPPRNDDPSLGPGQILPPQRSDSSRSTQALGVDVSPGGRLYTGHGGIPPAGPQFVPPPRGQSVMSPPPRGQSAMSPPPVGVNGMHPPIGPPPRSGSMPQQQFVGGQPGSGGQYFPGQQPFPGPVSGPRQAGQQHIPYQNLGPHGQSQLPPPQQIPYQHSGPAGGNGVSPIQHPSDPSLPGAIRKSPSTRSLGSQREHFSSHPQPTPPIPHMMLGHPHYQQTLPQDDHLRPMLPSNGFRPGIVSVVPSFIDHEPSPPDSPVEEQAPSGPAESSVLAAPKCKVFLKQQHAQWKSLGSAKLTLYQQVARKDKQVVVQADNKDKTLLISTMVLTDGVERVGKTGVAIEISDKGARTGIVYMIQLRNEKAAGQLFDLLIAGSDRAGH